MRKTYIMVKRALLQGFLQDLLESLNLEIENKSKQLKDKEIVKFFNVMYPEQ